MSAVARTLAELLGEHVDKSLEGLGRVDVILPVFSEGDWESQPRTYTLRWIAERYLEHWNTLTKEERRTAITAFDNDNEARRLKREEVELCPQRGEGEFQSAWFDYTMSASYWFHGQHVVTPEQAAMLMVGWNPLTDSAPNAENAKSKGKDDDYSKKLLKYDQFKGRFESAEKRDSKPRTLLEWVPIAKGVGLERDAWVLEYMALTGLKADAYPGPVCGGDQAAGQTGDVAGKAEGVTAVVEEPETKSWILRIQAEAARRWKVLRDSGANPTKHNIQDDLAKWCRDNNVLTDGGIYPSAAYIQRHVLRRWTPPPEG